MQKEKANEYRLRIAGRLEDYLRREHIMDRKGRFECPYCHHEAVLESPDHWACTVCGMHGDLIGYEEFRFPTRSEEELVRRVYARLGLKIGELDVFSSEELAKMDLEPLEFLVEGLLPKEGVTLLAAPAKTGKSWLVLQLAAALAKGEPFLDQETKRCRVLYLSLEDTPLRLRERSLALNCLATPGLDFCTRSELLGQGFEEAVDRYLQRHEDAGLVIVDTLQKVREASREMPSYGMDYDVMDRMKEIAARHHTALLLVHHTNKREDVSDAFSTVSGTMGILGGTDGMWLLRRPKRLDGSATLQIASREIPDALLRLQFGPDGPGWHFLGYDEGEEPSGRSEDGDELRRALLAWLRPGDEWVGTMSQLLELLELSEGYTVNRLGRELRGLEEKLQTEGVSLEWQRSKNARILYIWRRAEAAAPEAPREDPEDEELRWQALLAEEG